MTINGVRGRSVVFTREFVCATILGIALLVFGAAGVQAQQSTGRILGAVTDSSGAVVPNAQISITNQDTGVVLNTVSTSDGLYNDPAVPPGKYSVEAQAQGFSPVQVKDVEVTVGSDTRVDLKVAVGSVSQAVTVTEAIPQVNTTSSSIGGTVDEQKVADLPLNGRNWTDLELMQAGVSQLHTATSFGGAGSGTYYSSNGSDLRSNMYLLDGAIMQNFFAQNNSSIIGSSLGVDGIQEYKIITNMFGAQYGVTTGSQTIIASKAGTNAFHGDAYDYLRNNVLDAAEFFDPRQPGTDTSEVYTGKRNPPFHRNNFGGAIGGPIKKDKMFFEGVYEGVRQSWGQNIVSHTLPAACFTPSSTPGKYFPLGTATNPFPSAAAYTACAGGAAPGNVPAGGAGFVELPAVQSLQSLYPYPNITGESFNYSFPFIQPASENYEQGRLDYTINSKDSAFVRYTHDNADQTSPSGSVSSVNVAGFPQLVNLQHSSSEFLTVAENHIITPTLLNSLRLSGSRTTLATYFAANPNCGAPCTLAAAETGQSVPTLSAYAAEHLGGFAQTITPGNDGTLPITAWTTNNAPTPLPGNLQNIITATDDVFWTKGKHAFQFGFMYNHYQDDDGLLLFGGGTATFPNIAGFLAGNYTSLQWVTANSNQTGSWIYQSFGMYVQDDYRIFPRLTLNLGLRYEPYTSPRAAGSEQLYNYPNIATAAPPNFGTPESSVFVDPSWRNIAPRIGLAWDVRGNGKTAVRAGAGLYYVAGLFGGLLYNTLISNPPRSEVYTPNIPAAASPAFPLTLPLDSLQNDYGSAALAPRLVAYNIQQPTNAQWNLTVDRQLGWGTAISASYIGARGWHMFDIAEGNPIPYPGLTASGTPYFCTGVAGGAPTSTNPCNAASEAKVPARTNPNLGVTNVGTTGGEMWFNAIEAVVTKRLAQGLQFQATFTHERMEDDGYTQSSGDGAQTFQIPGFQQLDKAVSQYNIPNNFRFNAIYHIPNIPSDRFWAKPFHGWWMATIISAQSGPQINPAGNGFRSLQSTAIGYGERPSLDPSFNMSTLVTGNINDWFNTSMFDVPPTGTYGNAARNIIPGPNLRDVDFSANKDTHVPWLGEAGVLQFRAEIFNLFNHPNFSAPSGAVTTLAPTAVPCGGQVGSTLASGPCAGGTITSATPTIGSTIEHSREIQFSLKVIF